MTHFGNNFSIKFFSTIFSSIQLDELNLMHYTVNIKFFFRFALQLKYKNTKEIDIKLMSSLLLIFVSSHSTFIVNTNVTVLFSPRPRNIIIYV